MDEDHCEKKRLNETTDSIEISDEDEIVSLSPVESIVWDCTEVEFFKKIIDLNPFLRKMETIVGSKKTYNFIHWHFSNNGPADFSIIKLGVS